MLLHRLERLFRLYRTSARHLKWRAPRGLPNEIFLSFVYAITLTLKTRRGVTKKYIMFGPSPPQKKKTKKYIMLWLGVTKLRHRKRDAKQSFKDYDTVVVPACIICTVYIVVTWKSKYIFVISLYFIRVF